MARQQRILAKALVDITPTMVGLDWMKTKRVMALNKGDDCEIIYQDWDTEKGLNCLIRHHGSRYMWVNREWIGA
jgi:hypothetical protein